MEACSPARFAKPLRRGHVRRFTQVFVVAVVLCLVSSVAAAADDAPTFRIDARHTSAQSSDTLQPPLVRQWSIDLGGPVYFPLIVGDRVFVVAGNMPGPVHPNYGSRLYAISLTDGHVIWGPINADPWGGYYFSGLTYDGGRLFVAMGSGRIDAVDPSTGTFVWPQPVPVNGNGINAQPTAVNGVVYVTSDGNEYAPPGPVDPSDASVTALRESDGHVLWVGGIDSGDWSAPVVTNSGVYVTNACEDTWDFDPISGALIWHYQTGCFGGGGTTPALWQGRLYVRDTGNAPGTVLDASTGTSLGHFPSRHLPAFNGNTAYLIDQNSNYPGLIAWNVDTMTIAWSLPPPPGDWFGPIAPVFANGNVYAATAKGVLIAANAANGAELWSDNLGVPIVGTTNMDNGAETSGISIGNGWLLLPVNTTLVGYNSRPSRTGPPPSMTTIPSRQRASPPPVIPTLSPVPATATAVPSTQPTRSAVMMSSLAGDAERAIRIDPVQLAIRLVLLTLGWTSAG